LSAILLDLAVAVFFALLASDLLRAASRPMSAWISKDDPHTAIVLFTWVAACGVLGGRLASLLPAAPYFFGGLGILGWVAAIAMSSAFLRKQFKDRAARSVRGSWLLAVVATQSVSILASTDAVRLGSPLALDLSLCLWALGLGLYVLLIALLVRRLARGEVGLDGLAPDYWITMGALAISTVALTSVLHGATAPPVAQLLLGAAIATWLGGAAWIPYLCAAEIAGVRRHGIAITYDPLRWSTVFPLGMFSLATFEVARMVGLPILDPVAQFFFWPALALALLNSAGAVRAIAEANRQTC
ncbi:MAG: tellurite resistance/C4-dicarboxylate transporter family protein, partial [Candidatus Dormibacteraceae bacterium]